jgi:hypothetical protein
MSDSDILKLLHKPMKYLSDTFSRSIRNSIDGADDLYNDLVIVYYERKNRPTAKLIRRKSDKDISYYWYVLFKNYLLDKYRRYVKEKQIIKELTEVNNERFIQSIFSEKDSLI